MKFKLKCYFWITLLISNVAQTKVDNYPNKVTGFNVYVKTFIQYHKSDFQGIVGAGESIDLSNFAILNMMNNDSYQLPYNYSVITKRLSLLHSKVFMGGTYASDYLNLQNSQLQAPVTSMQRQIMRATDGSKPNTRPIFSQYAKQMDELQEYYRLKLAYATQPTVVSTKFYQNYLNMTAIDNNGTLANYFLIDKLNTNMVFDAQNDPREYFVVLIESYEQLMIQKIDFKLINGASPNKILFVFLNSPRITLTSSGASSLSGRDLEIGIPGTILAANTQVAFFENLLTGSIYAKSLNGDFYGTDQIGNQIRLNGGQINNGKFVCFTFRNCKDPDDFPNN